MNISSSVSASLSGAVTSTEPANFAQALADAQTARQRTITDDVSKVMSAPGVTGGSDLIRSSAKVRLQEMAKILQLFKKLYAMNPKAMARAIAEMARELKQVVKDYEAADKQEMGAAGGAAQALTNPPASDPTATATSTEATTAPATSDTEAAPTAAAPASPDAPTATASADDATAKLAAVAASGGTSLYDAVMGQIGQSVGFDGQDFIKQVKGLLKAMSETLETSRGWSLVQNGADKTRKIFKDADNAIADVKDEAQSMEHDMDVLNPTTGVHLSTAA